MNWQWLIDAGLITSSEGYYDKGGATADEYANMVSVAYKNADPAQRKRLVDELWSTGAFSGSKEYWYADHTDELNNLADAARNLSTVKGEETSYTGDPDITHVGLPGRPEVWKNSQTGMTYVVYFVPGIEPEIPMMWEVPNEEDLQSFFGDEAIVYDRQGTTAQFNDAGGLNFGTVDEVVLRGENPYAGWESQFEREREVLPWLNDPEVAALFASAWMEGRAPTEPELASTEWFRSKTAGEQQWYTLLSTQPKTAEQLMASNKLAIRRQMEQAGIYEPPDQAIDYIAQQWTTGLWTDEQMANQIALLSDPLKAGDRDSGLTNALSGVTYDTTAQNERYVQDELRRWLGPQFGQWTDTQVSEWAARLRNDPDGKDAFQAELSRQRLAVLPEYADSSLSYEDIATPWRNLAFNSWGQSMDETSDVFQRMLRANDAGVASQMLREEGLNQGVKKVEDAFLSDIGRSFGQGVRGYAR